MVRGLATRRSSGSNDDSEVLVSTHSKKSTHYVRIWVLKEKSASGFMPNSARCVHTFEVKHPVYSLALSENGKTVYAGLQSFAIAVFDLHTMRLSVKMKGHEGIPRALQIVGNNLYSAGQDMKIKVWDLKSVNTTTTLTGHKQHIRALVVDKEMSTIYSAGFDKTIKMWSYVG